MSDNSYPLAWPPDWPRTPQIMRSHNVRFADRSIHSALEGLEHELELLGATQVVVSSNVTLGRQNPIDVGVCCYFQYKKRPYALPCDKWKMVWQNLWALKSHIEALRGQERWGVGSLERAFAGYAALPAAAGSEDWRTVMGINEPNMSWDGIVDRYRALAQKRHPDVGGSQEAMSKLNSAYAAAKLEFGRHI